MSCQNNFNVMSKYHLYFGNIYIHNIIAKQEKSCADNISQSYSTMSTESRLDT